MEKRELNEREKAFIEALFSDEAGGDAHKAKVMAGYASTYTTSTLVKRLESEIIAATKQFFSQNAPKAAIKLAGIMDNPAEIGNKELLAVTKDLLDRAGLAKTEKVELSTQDAIFILPAKVPTVYEEDDDEETT